MRFSIVVVAACGGSGATKPPPAPPVPVAHVSTCPEAATGLERGTRDVRDPEESLLGPMRERCVADRWSPAAIDCFAKMHEGDLAKCAGHLEARARDKLFDVIGGGTQDEEAIAAIVAKLATVTIGISECDRFVSAVSTVMSCRTMPLDTRVQLGNETADFWSLPTERLSMQAQLRMAQVCGKSLADLQQRAVAAGCMP